MRDRDATIKLAEALITQFILEEKVIMVTGNSFAGNCIGVIAAVPHLGFKGICMLDGPSAVNRADLVSLKGKGGHGVPVIQTCSNHLIANEQETRRSNTVSSNGTAIKAISTNDDNRAVQELYLWPFANTIKAETTTIITFTRRTRLRGFTVLDWFATHSAADPINASLDLEMPDIIPSDYPGSIIFFSDKVFEAVANGTVSESRSDDMTRSFLTPVPPPFLLREIGFEVVKEGGSIPDDFVFTHGCDRGVYLPPAPPETCHVFQPTLAIEGFDRTSFALAGNLTTVIGNMADFCGTTVVMMHTGGVNTIPWANHTKIGATLAAHYPGQESGHSLAWQSDFTEEYS
ncbi:beta-glucosidase [Colletotrichum orchidophilum]|uniref:beta-glucosidase n=1 Tax=Colletotrichum orchidophilum TaxID=1209926 RepID=A0A1G4AQ48_9PEZI|nr:beta-glucosidase [Colletotrichum orchidophilum]OHE91297.1 beta-glucosidase [Colletotrichum orchidophilum]